jgi:hypothetical protein
LSTQRLQSIKNIFFAVFAVFAVRFRGLAKQLQKIKMRLINQRIYNFQWLDDVNLQYVISGKQKEVSSRSLQWEHAQSIFSFLHLTPFSTVQEKFHPPLHFGQTGEITS